MSERYTMFISALSGGVFFLFFPLRLHHPSPARYIFICKGNNNNNNRISIMMYAKTNRSRDARVPPRRLVDNNNKSGACVLTANPITNSSEHFFYDLGRVTSSTCFFFVNWGQIIKRVKSDIFSYAVMGGFSFHPVLFEK